MPESPRLSPPLRRRTQSDAKRATQVADRIIEDVMARQWPVGQVLGSEGDLLERYQVSRAVFREAVRLVEHREVARTRRGPGGGLVVTEPSVQAVIDAVVLYLHRVDARLDEVFEARIALEEIACELSARRLEEADLLQLRRFADDAGSGLDSDPRALHSCLAVATGNPAIQLFIEVFNRVSRLYSTGWKGFGADALSEMAHAHARIAQAVIAGDAATARRRMRKHLEAEAEYVRRRRSTRQLIPESQIVDRNTRGKLAETVAFAVARRVVAEDLKPGDLIGTEPELIERHGVSRAVFREAVRLLEYHRIAGMRRGPGGGLFVLAPSIEAVSDVVAIYLARQGMELAQLSELRTAVEVALVDLAVTRLDGDAPDRIRAAVERERTAAGSNGTDAAHDLHATLAAVSGNRVLELVALVLIRLSRLHQVEHLAAASQEQVRAEVLRAHTAIADAVLAGDRELARHRVQRHLDALAAVVR